MTKSFFNKFFILISYALRDASRSRVILTLIIISLSVSSATVLATIAMLDGFNQTLTNGAIDADAHLIITPKESTYSPIKNLDLVVSELSKIEDIKTFSVRSYALGGINYKGSIVPAYTFAGFTEQYEAETTKIPERLISGRWFAGSEKNEVVLGATLADALVAQEYDKIRIPVGEEIEIIPYAGKSEKYKVVGIIDAKTFHPNWIVFFNKEKLEQLDSSRINSEIVIKLKNIKTLEQTKKEILNKNLGVDVATWNEKAAYIKDILSAIGFITNLVSRLLTFTIFIIISIIVFINVSQKKRQLGIMKAMGAGNIFIISIYVIGTLIYSVLSFSIGFLLFSMIHLYSQNHPIPLLIGDFNTAIERGNIIKTMIILLIASIGGSFIPAYLAAKTKIANIIIDRD